MILYKIAIAPLDWGLGHVVRCIPIINLLQKNGYQIHLLGKGLSGEYLQKAFPHLPYTHFPGYEINYPLNGNFTAWALFNGPKFLRSIGKENQFIERFALKHNIDCIISDNRYGAFIRKKPSVFITHQLSPILPANLRFAKAPTLALFRYWYSFFSEIWVPDFPDKHSLCSTLATMKGVSPLFIGQKSSFTPQHVPQEKNSLLCILSGPEPQRSLLEEKLEEAAVHLHHLKVSIVRGTTKEKKHKRDKITYYDMLLPHQLANLVAKHQHLLSRSGYSSLMDWIAAQRTAILIPTPGQTEQQFLGEQLHKNNQWPLILQQHLSPNSLAAALHSKPIPFTLPNTNFDQIIEMSLSKLIKKAP